MASAITSALAVFNTKIGSLPIPPIFLLTLLTIIWAVVISHLKIREMQLSESFVRFGSLVVMVKRVTGNTITN